MQTDGRYKLPPVDLLYPPSHNMHLQQLHAIAIKEMKTRFPFISISVNLYVKMNEQLDKFPS